jgi:hypothetical protein
VLYAPGIILSLNSEEPNKQFLEACGNIVNIISLIGFAKDSIKQLLSHIFCANIDALVSLPDLALPLIANLYLKAFTIFPPI